MNPHISPDCGTPASTLDARRERAVHRAITRACQNPSDARLALADRLQALPATYYEIADDAIRSATHDYWVDGVHTARWAEAIELVRDRYGVTGAEAEQAIEAGRRGL